MTGILDSVQQLKMLFPIAVAENDGSGGLNLLCCLVYVRLYVFMWTLHSA